MDVALCPDFTGVRLGGRRPLPADSRGAHLACSQPLTLLLLSFLAASILSFPWRPWSGLWVPILTIRPTLYSGLLTGASCSAGGPTLVSTRVARVHPLALDPQAPSAARSPGSPEGKTTPLPRSPLGAGFRVPMESGHSCLFVSGYRVDRR